MNEYVETARVALQQQRHVEVASHDVRAGEGEGEGSFRVTVFTAERDVECECEVDAATATALVRAGAVLRAVIGLGIHRHEMRELRDRADAAASRAREQVERIAVLGERTRLLCQDVATLVAETRRLSTRRK